MFSGAHYRFLFLERKEQACSTDWLEPLSMYVTGVHKIQHQSLLLMLENIGEVFGDVGACRGPPVSMDVDPDGATKFSQRVKSLLPYIQKWMRLWTGWWSKVS